MRKYRLFGIFNPIDALLVLLVAVIIWGAYTLAQPQRVVADSGRLIHFTLELGARPEGFYQEIALGSTVYYVTRGWEIGTVVAVYSLPYLQDAPDEAAGRIRRAEVEGLEFTYIVVEAWADISDYSTNVGALSIAVNRAMPVRSRDFAGRSFVTNIEWVN